MIINIQGMELTPEEIRSFQKVFPNTPASAVMNKIIQKCMEYWNGVSMTMNVSDAGLRQAQGALQCLGVIDSDVRKVLQYNLDAGEDESTDTEEEDNGGPDLF